ncbi:MAG: cell envelope integrity protein TolA [Bacteroidota bacterium]
MFTLGTNGRINVKLVPGVDGLIERPEDPTGRAMPDAPPATADEVEALRQRVRELEAERAQLKTHIEQLEAEAASSRTTASVDQARREQEDAANWIESLKLEEPLDSSELESLGVTGAHERMRVAFDVLFGFTKQLEQTTDRILRATGSSDSTGIFGRRSFAQRLGQALRAPDSDRSRRILEEQVQFLLRGWTTGTLRIYRDGVEDWAQGFLARIAPKAIQIRAGISDNKLNFGLGHRAIWETYKGFVLELTAAVLVEEIDESVQARIPELGDGR